MSRHLTHRFWFCFLTSWMGAGLAVAARSVEPLGLATPFMAAIVISLIDGWWPETTIESATISSERVVEGDLLEFSVEVATEKKTWVDLELQFPATLEPAAASRLVTVVEGRRRFTVPLMAARWGASGPEWAVVVSRDFLGLSERVLRHPLHLPVRIHPPSEHLAGLLPLHRQRAVSGDHRARAKGPGSEFAEVRAYRTGDPVRMVHPGLSARRNEPTVVERHPDRSSDVALLVDSAQDLGVDLDTSLRWTVTAAMALAERHLRAQDRVGLLDVGHGVRWLPAKLGRRHLHVLVDSLLATEVSLRQVGASSSLPVGQLPKGATVIAISPLINEMVLASLVSLRSRGHEILVLKPPTPPPEPHIDLLAQRIFRLGNQINERWLRDRGVLVIPWSTGDSLDHVMSRVIRNIGRSRSRR